MRPHVGIVRFFEAIWARLFVTEVESTEESPEAWFDRMLSHV